MNLRKLELIVRRRKVIAAEKQFKEAQDGGAGKAETGCCWSSSVAPPLLAPKTSTI